MKFVPKLNVYSVLMLLIMLIFPLVGPKRDYLSARSFMMDMFMRGAPPEIRDRCFPHFTCSTDTQNIKKVFEDVRNTIMADNIGDGVKSLE